MSQADKIRVAVAFLVRQRRAANEAAQAHKFIVENALSILHRHLDYFCQVHEPWLFVVAHVGCVTEFTAQGGHPAACLRL
jgi:hypothetical protein